MRAVTLFCVKNGSECYHFTVSTSNNNIIISFTLAFMTLTIMQQKTTLEAEALQHFSQVTSSWAK